MTNFESTRILIVDDEAFMRQTIRQMLKVMGSLMVSEAADGRAALYEVDKFKPDLVLCDVSMAPMTGIKFIEKLRAHADPERRQTPVIMLTAHTDEKIVADALKLGISGYVVKPVSPRHLAERVNAALKPRAAQGEKGAA